MATTTSECRYALKSTAGRWYDEMRGMSSPYLEDASLYRSSERAENVRQQFAASDIWNVVAVEVETTLKELAQED